MRGEAGADRNVYKNHEKEEIESGHHILVFDMLNLQIDMATHQADQQ